MEKIKYHRQELLSIKSDIVFKVVFEKPENVDIPDFNLLDNDSFLNRYHYMNTDDEVKRIL